MAGADAHGRHRFPARVALAMAIVTVTLAGCIGGDGSTASDGAPDAPVLERTDAEPARGPETVAVSGQGSLPFQVCGASACVSMVGFSGWGFLYGNGTLEGLSVTVSPSAAAYSGVEVQVTARCTVAEDEGNRTGGRRACSRESTIETSGVLPVTLTGDGLAWTSGAVEVLVEVTGAVGSAAGGTGEPIELEGTLSVQR